MASVAELGLRSFQKVALNRGRMNRMARNAADIVLLVFGSQKITVLLTEFVTVETTTACIRRRELRETDDLRNIASVFNVLFTGPVTCFATLPFDPAALLKIVLPVRSAVIALGLRVMASSADIAPDVKRSIRWPV